MKIGDIMTPKCHDIPKEFWYPVNSESREALVYRLTKLSNDISDEDFLSNYEMDKSRGTIRAGNLGDDRYYGLSVLEDKSDAEVLLKKIAAKRNLKGIACGKTRVTDGVIRQTPSLTLPSHITWWLFEGAAPETYFTSIQDGEDNE